MSLDLSVTIYDVDSSKVNIDDSQVNKVYYSEKIGLRQVRNYCPVGFNCPRSSLFKWKDLPVLKKDNIARIYQNICLEKRNHQILMAKCQRL